MKIQPLLPLLLAFLLAAGHLPAAEPLPVPVAPDDPALALQGAWSNDFRGAWTGVGLKFRTDAAEVNLLFEDSAPGGDNPNGGFRNNYLAVQVDDGEPAVIPLQAGQERYRVPGLDGQAHTVTVFKRTEPLFGAIQFKGLELAAGGRLLDPPPPAEIRLQVIGDSISAGYGNEGTGPKDRFRHETQNGWMTYWAIAAREIGADHRCAAWSGKGVYRDRENNLEDNLPDLWCLAVPGKRPAPERKGGKWTPTHVVINLGTNDVAQGIPSEEDFLGAYRALVADIHRTAPKAKIYVVFGPMINARKHGAIRDYLTTLAAEDSRIQLVTLTNPYGVDGAGAAWHPNVKANQAMAEQLLAQMRLK